MGEEGIVQELKGAPSLLGTGCHYRPGPLAPSHALVSARALRDAAVDHDVADRLLGQVVGRFHAGLRQEGEIVLGIAPAKARGQGPRLATRRRMTHLLEKVPPN